MRGVGGFAQVTGGIACDMAGIVVQVTVVGVLAGCWV